MKANTMAVGGLAMLLAASLALPVVAQEEKKAEKPKEAAKRRERRLRRKEPKLQELLQ